jgi:hypothetical protein
LPTPLPSRIGLLWSSAAANSETWIHGLLLRLICVFTYYRWKRRSLAFFTWLLKGDMATLHVFREQNLLPPMPLSLQLKK